MQQILRNSDNLVYKKMLTGPRLTPAHIKGRQKWAHDHVDWRARWKKVVFSDEKKFNLDGPDGFAKYWHDLRKEERYFSKRQHGGGSVMLWGAMSWYGLSDLCVIHGRMNSEQYCEVLERCLLPFAEQNCPEGWIFQHDNAPCHASQYTKTWCSDNYVDVLPWPAKSPDLNIIENLWGILVRMVYKNFKQFSNVEELKEEIIRCWSNIPNETIKRLYKAMLKRCVAVIEQHGKKIKN